jgi:uncharacterized protein (TIGR02996 family)
MDDRYLRAILASREDSPRLAYTEWLEERGDPRARYLRAEMDAFNLPRKGRQFGSAIKALRKLGETLDPLWVARVSRPPVGVCCDRVKFRGSGTALSPTDVNVLERRLSVTLPADYRAFLLNYNGGCPTPSTIAEGDGKDLFVEEFYSVPKRVGIAPLGLRNDLEECAHRFWVQDPEFPEEKANRAAIDLARTLLPIGISNGLYLFLVLTGRHGGAVGICDVGDFELHEMRVVAPSFAAFLGMIAESKTMPEDADTEC